MDHTPAQTSVLSLHGFAAVFHILQPNWTVTLQKPRHSIGFSLPKVWTFQQGNVVVDKETLPL